MFLVIGIVGCGSPTAAPDRSVEDAGPYAVATTRYLARGATRDVVTQAWYPTMAPPAQHPIEALEIEPLRTDYAQLLAAAGPCPTRTLEVALDGAAEPGSFPLVIASHCHLCTRLTNATTAARLASHGYVVVAVDHEGDTLWNLRAGNETGLTREALDRRVEDLQIVLDDPAPPTPVRDADRTRIGAFGHSFGAVTAGRLAQIDDRILAAAALAAPIENPFIPGVTLAEIPKPLLFLVAQEDNSITEFGNKFIRDNYAAAPAAAWKLELADAGHWSVSDLVGLVDTFAAGCGVDERQTDGEEFTYLDPQTGRAITAAYVTAFFRANLDGDEGARAYLARGFPDAVVDAVHHD